MKKTILGLVLTFFLLILAPEAEARGTHVRGYVRHNGTYVKPYRRTQADHFKLNNYSYHGNYNPFTGKKGYHRK